MKRPSLAGLLRLLVALGLTGYLLWKSNPAAVLQASAGIDLRYIGLAVLLVLVDRGLMAYRWLVLLRPVAGARQMSLGLVMRIFFVSTFVGVFLPTSVGGDAVRAYSLARHNVPGAAAVVSVFMDRMLGVLSILLLATAGLFLGHDLIAEPVIVAALLVTTAGCLVTGVLIYSSTAATWICRLLDRLPNGAIRRLGHASLDAVQQYKTHHRELTNVFASSVGVQVLRVLQGYCVGLALGLQVPVATYFAFIPLILLVMLLPITINGIGTSQAAFVWLFARVGVSSPAAFALSILYVALGIVGSLPGGFLYATRGPDRATS